MTVAKEPVDEAAHLLDKTITFPDGSSFTRHQPITGLRKDDEEARILCICRKDGDDDTEYVMKIKIQVPKPNEKTDLLPGPSDPSAAEIEALERFKKADIQSVPHLVNWTRQAQGPQGLLPGGYIVFTVMTKMPGPSLLDLAFWTLPEQERDEIRALFLQELQALWQLGIAPYDCALRNILWDRESRKCSIIDFEYWKPIEGLNIPASPPEIERELQRWGVVRRPPATTWAAEWGFSQ